MSYFNIRINQENTSFTLTEKSAMPTNGRVKPLGTSALTLLQTIEKIITEHLPNASELQQTEEARLMELWGKAHALRKGYMRKIAALEVRWGILSFIWRFFARIHQKVYLIETLYRRIDELADATLLNRPSPFTGVPIRLIGYLSTFLPKQDIPHFSLANKRIKEGVNLGTIMRARQYGFDGETQDLQGARDFLRDLYKAIFYLAFNHTFNHSDRPTGYDRPYRFLTLYHGRVSDDQLSDDFEIDFNIFRAYRSVNPDHFEGYFGISRNYIKEHARDPKPTIHRVQAYNNTNGQKIIPDPEATIRRLQQFIAQYLKREEKVASLLLLYACCASRFGIEMHCAFGSSPRIWNIAPWIKFLLFIGADPNFTSKFSPRSPLMHLIRSFSCTSTDLHADTSLTIDYLLASKNINVNYQDHKFRTALHYATSLKNTELVRILLDKKADPNLRDMIGRRPLEIALELKHAELIEILKKVTTQV